MNFIDKTPTYQLITASLKMGQENPNLFKNGQKYQTLETKSFLHFIVDGNIKILSLTEMVSGSSSVHLRLLLDRFS